MYVFDVCLCWVNIGCIVVGLLGLSDIGSTGVPVVNRTGPTNGSLNGVVGVIEIISRPFQSRTTDSRVWAMTVAIQAPEMDTVPCQARHGLGMLVFCPVEGRKKELLACPLW